MATIPFDKDWQCEDDLKAMIKLCEDKNLKCRNGHSSDQTLLNLEYLYFICALIGARMTETAKSEKLYETCFVEMLGYASNSFAAIFANSNYDTFNIVETKMPSN